MAPPQPPSRRRSPGRQAINANSRTRPRPKTSHRDRCVPAGLPPVRDSRRHSPTWSIEQEPRIEQWQRQRLPSGPKSPSTANAPSGDHSPETHPNHGAEPDHPQRRSTRDSSRPTVVEGRPSGVVVEGAEAQPTPMMGPTFQYGTQFLYKKSGKPEQPGLPQGNGRKRAETDRKAGHSHFRATPS